MGRARVSQHGGLELGLFTKLFIETKENEVQGVGAMENICVQLPGLRKLRFQMSFARWGHYVLGGEGNEVLEGWWYYSVGECSTRAQG